MREKIVYVEGESDKIFLTILNEFKNLGLKDSNIINCGSKDKLSKEAESIKENLKLKIFTSFLIQTTKREKLKFKK
ncbi:hypothetical protein VN1203_03940 [Helicobacter pylori]|nr:hypothetical protein VN1203_03940 [Helicobacter pylori]